MHKRDYGRLIWGGFLVALGLLLLVDNLGFLGDLEGLVWSLGLGFVSLVCVILYLRDRQQWWVLIPGLALAGIALGIFLDWADVTTGDINGALVTGGIGLAFLLVFVSDRRNLWALIPAMTMGGIGLAVFLEEIDLISDAAVAGIIVGGVAMGFISIFLYDRKHWWALFPGVPIGTVAFFLLVASAAELICPTLLILLGLLMLWGNLSGGLRRRPRPKRKPARSRPQKEPARQRTPTLEQEIDQALAEDDEPGSLDDLPPLPELPPTEPGDVVPERPSSLEVEIDEALKEEDKDEPDAPQMPKPPQAG